MKKAKSKSPFVTIYLGSTYLERDQWDYLRKRGFSREDIRQLIVQNGEESLASYVLCGDLDKKVEK